MKSRIFIVMLRQPGKKDRRTDPFWEFGSFGCTHCHGKNLLHPRHCHIAENGESDDRLAFVQGGDKGLRLLLVTPSVKRINHSGEAGPIELKWNPNHKPFCYKSAPSLFDSPSPRFPEKFPKLANYVKETNRPTMDAKFASRFRSRTKPLDPDLAVELDKAFQSALNAAHVSDFMHVYTDALPWFDNALSLKDRKREYMRFQAGLNNPHQRNRCK